MKILKGLFIALVVLVAICSLGADSLPASFVELDELPERIDDYTFPAFMNDSCYDYLGCVTKQIDHEPDAPTEQETEFFFYSKETPGDFTDHIKYEPTTVCLTKIGTSCQDYPYDLGAIEKATFDPTKRSIIIISGFKSKAETDWQKEIKTNWLQVDDVNVIIVAWTGGNDGGSMKVDYPNAVANTRIVARQISALLFYLAKLKANITIPGNVDFVRRITFIGHSLGAQISGFVGKDFNGDLGRITGLDPAGPYFNTIDRALKLDRLDAQFVDIFHSNAGRGIQLRLGHLKPMGHIDYYVNGGQTQPHCGYNQVPCAHKMITKTYVRLLKTHVGAGNKLEQVIPLYAFPADNYKIFERGQSFAELCPLYSMPEKVADLMSDDFQYCLLPMDLVSPYNEVRKFLEVNYGNIISLDSALNPVNQTYFDTFGIDTAEPILLRIQYQLPDSMKSLSLEKKSEISIRSFFMIDSFDGGPGEIYDDIKETQVELISGSSQNMNTYNFLKPTLSRASINATASLARLIKNNFYLSEPNKESKIRAAIGFVFPYKLLITSKKIFKNYIPGKKDKEVPMNGYVSGLTFTALRSSNRRLLAIYGLKAAAGVEISILNDENRDPWPQMDPLVNFDGERNMTSIELFLERLVIGPAR